MLTADLIVSIEQLLRQDDVRGVRVAERPQLAAAHQAEALVRGDDPCFFGRQGVLLAEQLEDRGRHRRLAAIGVHFLATSGHQRGRRVEMARDAVVSRDRIHETLWHDLVREVRNVHPSFRSQRVLEAHSAAEGHDDDAALGLLGPTCWLREDPARQPPVRETGRHHAERFTPPEDAGEGALNTQRSRLPRSCAPRPGTRKDDRRRAGCHRLPSSTAIRPQPGPSPPGRRRSAS